MDSVTLFQAAVLGIVQGLTEFLPVSSSAHLALAPWMLGWRDPGLAFDVALHLGTLIALLWYFRAEWKSLIASAWQIVVTRRVATEDQRRVVLLAIATIPGGLAGKLLDDYAETTFRSPTLIATMLVLMGIVLWAVDRKAPADRPLEAMRPRQALLIGLAQVFALLPGVSRSGSTITAGRALRFDRKSAAVFSFLMSMPITAAAVVFKLPEALRSEASGAAIIVGVISAAISGWLAITVLLRYVTRHGYGIFAVYRLALGALVFGLIYMGRS
jgi:undecaprenyl-diphosphatase